MLLASVVVPALTQDAAGHCYSCGCILSGVQRCLPDRGARMDGEAAGICGWYGCLLRGASIGE